MGKIIEYIVPEKEILKKSKYICSVIEQGRDGNSSGVYILVDGREKAKEKTAGMLTAGWDHPTF